MKAQYIEIKENGNKFYYSDQEMKNLHREDGPAIIDINGDKEWYQNHKLHRMDGPAIEGHNGNKVWYVNEDFIFSVDSRDNIIDRME